MSMKRGPIRRRTWWLVGLGAGVVAAVALSGTVLDDDRASVQPAHFASDTPPHRAAVRAGVRTIQAFLDAYGRDGYSVASHRYLAPGLQLDSDAGVPRLASGSVVDDRVSSWQSPRHFTLEVDLDLRFDGDPLAWDQGVNTRFVTFTRSDGVLRIVEIASSP